MSVNETITIGSMLGTACALVVAAWQSYRAKKLEAVKQLDLAKDELIKVTRESAEAWKKRHDDLHLEYVAYRENRHKSDNDTNGMLLRLTADNADLRAKTDMTPILEHQREQALINQKVIEGLTKSTAALDLLIESLVLNKQQAIERVAARLGEANS